MFERSPTQKRAWVGVELGAKNGELNVSGCLGPPDPGTPSRHLRDPVLGGWTQRTLGSHWVQGCGYAGKRDSCLPAVSSWGILAQAGSVCLQGTSSKGRRKKWQESWLLNNFLRVPSLLPRLTGFSPPPWQLEQLKLFWTFYLLLPSCSVILVGTPPTILPTLGPLTPSFSTQLLPREPHLKLCLFLLIWWLEGPANDTAVWGRPYPHSVGEESWKGLDFCHPG